MPKLKNVTHEEIQTALLAANDVQSDAHDFKSRIEQGYCDDLPDITMTAANWLAVSRSLADLAGALLTKAFVQEQRRELAELKARGAKKE